MLHSRVRRAVKIRDRVGTLITDETEAVNNEGKAKVSRDFFKTVYVKENQTSPPLMDSRTNARLHDIEITQEMVEALMEKLNVKKATGQDGVHPMLLRECRRELSGPLTKLFRMCLDTGKVPDSWKRAEVTPIFKGGKKFDPTNYRPVSLTSLISKLMETVIRAAIIEHLETNNLFSDAQHGFRKGRSCLTNLLETLEDWTKAIDEGKQVDCIYLDLKKAFDRVSHPALLRKLEAHGIEGKVLRWIKNFLQGRTQRVRVEEAVSEWEAVKSGVAQGTVLGPTLFLVFINDLGDDVASFIKIFADDTKVYRTIERREDCDVLQRDISKLQTKAGEWGMMYNEKKCTVMNIGRIVEHFEYHLKNESNDNVPLKNSKCEKDLGVKIQNNLKIGEQCTSATQKANHAMRQLKNTFRYMTPPIFRNVYCSYVRPHLENSIQAWSPHLAKDIEKLEKVQRSATRTVRGIGKRTYEEMLEILGLHRLNKRRERGDIIETYKILNGIEKVDSRNFFRMNTGSITRGKEEKIYKERSRLEIRRNFFSQRVVNVWNSLPSSVRHSETVPQLKRKIDKHFEKDGLSILYIHYIMGI